MSAFFFLYTEDKILDYCLGLKSVMSGAFFFPKKAHKFSESFASFPERTLPIVVSQLKKSESGPRVAVVPVLVVVARESATFPGQESWGHREESATC